MARTCRAIWPKRTASFFIIIPQKLLVGDKNLQSLRSLRQVIFSAPGLVVLGQRLCGLHHLRTIQPRGFEGGGFQLCGSHISLKSPLFWGKQVGFLVFLQLLRRHLMIPREGKAVHESIGRVAAVDAENARGLAVARVRDGHILVGVPVQVVDDAGTPVPAAYPPDIRRAQRVRDFVGPI